MPKHKSTIIYPLAALRSLPLHTQLLSTANKTAITASPDAITDLVRVLGYIQIDTLHVVHRAHNVALWSRFGNYAIEDFHRLIYAPGERRLYEGWGHAASIIALEDYRYHRWRTDKKISFNLGFDDWLSKPGNRALVDQVLDRIRAEGGLRVSDFEYTGPRREPWYDWKPVKRALEALFAHGDLMVADRVNFQRVYDLRERVVPDRVDTSPVDPEVGRRYCLEQAAKALGVFEAKHLTFYAYMRATPARPLVRALVDDGALVEIRGETISGAQKWLVHRDNLPLLQRAADGEISPARTTFLSPFDSLFWAGDRDQKLWAFHQLLEAYKPEAERVYGYFCFPILHKDRLVGRFDPKLDRSNGVMHLNALYLEPGVEPDDELVADVAAAMRDFIDWHGARDLRIAKSEPAVFGEKLAQAL